MNTQHFTTNNNQKFPLSTETLAFMQEQIKLAYGLTDLAGKNVIVRQSSATETGLVIFDGELLPLTGTPSRFITIAERTEQMSVEGKFEGNVRTTRTASYIPIKKAKSSSKTKIALSFTMLKSIDTLMSELDEAKKHHVPTGSIMMWSGAITAIPSGWALCDGQNGTPDLRGRFIVGASNGEVTIDGARYNYLVGDMGGRHKVQLTINEMPSHNHGGETNGGTTDGSHIHTIPVTSDTLTIDHSISGVTRARTGTGKTSNDGAHKHTIQSQGGGGYHENRPAYYALAYIIKVI